MSNIDNNFNKNNEFFQGMDQGLYSSYSFQDKVIMEEPLRASKLRLSDGSDAKGRYTQIDCFDCFSEETKQMNKGGAIELQDNCCINQIENNVEENSVKEEFKIIMVGDLGAGKTSIIKRYIFNKFDSNDTSELEEETLTKTLKLNKDTVVNLNISDTATERFSIIPKQLYRDVHAVIIVIDITEKDSFLKLEKRIKHTREISPRDAVIFVIGNKTDLNVLRKISTAEGHSLAQRNNATYQEVSAKTGNNIDLVFEELANQIIEIQKQNTGDNKVERFKDRKSIGLQEMNKNNIRRKCCHN